MWKCKECGGEIFEIEKETITTKFKIDKDIERIKKIDSENTGDVYSIYECEKCGEVAFYEEDLEDIAEWEED